MSEKTKSIIEAVTALIVNGLVILNMILQAAGKPALEIGNETISMTINAIFLIITTIYTWYKNNNLTNAALMGQEVINAIKDDREVTVDIKK